MKKFILLLLVIAGCSEPVFRSGWVTEISPEIFNARFETSKGSFDLQITREYSPFAVDRFYQLLKHRLYDNTLFYRVIPNFVAQFAVSDTAVLKKWKAFPVPDEKVVSSNTRGTISFARGENGRGFALFINLKNNPKLDTQRVKAVIGYPPLGKVIRGMEVVDSLYAGYGNSTIEQERNLYRNRSVFLDSFPKLDLIRKAYILKPGKDVN